MERKYRLALEQKKAKEALLLLKSCWQSVNSSFSVATKTVLEKGPKNRHFSLMQVDPKVFRAKRFGTPDFLCDLLSSHFLIFEEYRAQLFEHMIQ